MGFRDLNFASSIVVKSQLLLASVWTQQVCTVGTDGWGTSSCESRAIRIIDFMFSFYNLNLGRLKCTKDCQYHVILYIWRKSFQYKTLL